MKYIHKFIKTYMWIHKRITTISIWINVIYRFICLVRHWMRTRSDKVVGKSPIKSICLSIKNGMKTILYIRNPDRFFTCSMACRLNTYWSRLVNSIVSYLSYPISFINVLWTSLSWIPRYRMVIAGLEWLYRLQMISKPTPCIVLWI